MKTSKKVGKSSKAIVGENDQRFTRSRDARKNFLAKKKGLFGSKIFVCVYCGKLVRQSNMEVDHCIPVHSAKTNPFVRFYIRFIGLFQNKEDRNQGINGVWNLVPACSKCNGAKSDKTGAWVIRGIVGRYVFPAIWYGAAAGTALFAVQYAMTGTGPFIYVVDGLRYVGEGLIKLSEVFTV